MTGPHKTGLALGLYIWPTFCCQVENFRRSSWAVEYPSGDFKILSFHPIHNKNSFLFQPDGAAFSFHVMAVGAASKPDNRLLKFLCVDWKSTLECLPFPRSPSLTNPVYKYNTSRSYNNRSCQPVSDSQRGAVGNSTVTQKCPDSSGPFDCDKSPMNLQRGIVCIRRVYV